MKTKDPVLWFTGGVNFLGIALLVYMWCYADPDKLSNALSGLQAGDWSIIRVYLTVALVCFLLVYSSIVFRYQFYREGRNRRGDHLELRSPDDRRLVGFINIDGSTVIAANNRHYNPVNVVLQDDTSRQNLKSILAGLSIVVIDIGENLAQDVDIETHPLFWLGSIYLWCPQAKIICKSDRVHSRLTRIQIVHDMDELRASLQKLQ